MPEEEEDFRSSANQLGCTDVPGLSVTWSKTTVLSVYHIPTVLNKLVDHHTILLGKDGYVICQLLPLVTEVSSQSCG